MNPSFAVAALFALALPSLLLGEEPTATSPVALPRTMQFDLTSETGDTYRIFIGEPLNPPPAAGAPVVYVLDGNPNFPAMLSAVHRGEPASASLVVGIGYPTDDAKVQSARRYYDLTSEADPAWLATQPPNMRPERTGGSEAFLRFLFDELRPEIERRYPIDRNRQALFGHSLGGRFVLNAYFERPDAFQIYVASSPSIWWNDRDVLARERDFVANAEGPSNATLIVTAGERERPDSDAPVERAKLLAERRMVENASELVERLAALPAAGGIVRFEAFKDENHGSALLPACNRAAQALIRTGRPTATPAR